MILTLIHSLIFVLFKTHTPLSGLFFYSECIYDITSFIDYNRIEDRNINEWQKKGIRIIIRSTFHWYLIKCSKIKSGMILAVKIAGADCLPLMYTPNWFIDYCTMYKQTFFRPNKYFAFCSQQSKWCTLTLTQFQIALSCSIHA